MILDSTRLEQYYFEKICSIPHTSGNEKALSDYIVSIAQKYGHNYIQDEMYNVIVIIPPTPGYEEKEAIMISGHMDMVGTKTGHSHFDFLNDPLHIYIDNGLLKAHETTLGADDGIAISYMLALMSDSSYMHPRIECVFTVQEEIGCYGSHFIDLSSLTAKRMIGLDSVGEHQITVGNYCSDKIEIIHHYDTIQQKHTAYRLTLSGFNAPIVAAQPLSWIDNAILYTMKWLYDCHHPFQIAHIQGGKAENMSPQECQIDIIIDENTLSLLKNSIDPSLSLNIQEITIDAYLDSSSSEHLIETVLEIPNGPLEVNQDMMLSSFLLGTIEFQQGKLQIVGSSRCQNQFYNKKVIHLLQNQCHKSLSQMHIFPRYQSWEYQEHSPLKELFRELVKQHWHKDIEEKLCPGGLEITDFIDKIPGLDVLSFGPLAGNFHVPGEWLDIASFSRTYDLLKLLLEQ